MTIWIMDWFCTSRVVVYPPTPLFQDLLFQVKLDYILSVFAQSIPRILEPSKDVCNMSDTQATFRVSVKTSHDPSLKFERHVTSIPAFMFRKDMVYRRCHKNNGLRRQRIK